ncbi:unnamed protein product [Schistocephalus solidus]|uniref:C2H2-type domain-containing protein n=1 Tax=Schistocephalus solidus TaxID=70667 RepID=A0A183SFJ2_SCHSO|nr:unnamed protein product [Schistocephalus solidus]
MPRPCQHGRAVNASFARESARLDIFGRNAPAIRQFQLLQTTSLYSSPVSPTTAATPAFGFTTSITTASDGDSLLNCPQCDRTFTSRIGLDGHLRIHPEITLSSALIVLVHSLIAWPHAFGHMRIHDSEIHRNADISDTLCTSSTPAILTAIAIPSTTSDNHPAHPDFSCQHRTQNLNSRISLAGQLQIHRTEASKPVPGAPTYSRRARLHCPHCSRTFKHNMGL